jgi:ABC-type multidrug transport system ATPase subunit
MLSVSSVVGGQEFTEIFMLHVSNVSKNYGAEPVLADVSFVINSGERAGFVGPNGCGKTTLLRIIAGELTQTYDRMFIRHIATGIWELREGHIYLPPKTGPQAKMD